MILGNAGIVTAVSTLILSFIGADERSQWLYRGTLLLVGLALLWTIATSKRIEHWMMQRLQSILRRFTDLEAIDFVELLDLSGSYSVRTLKVEPDDWVEGKRLDEVKLFQEGITILGVHRPGGDYLGIPRGETTLEADDQLVLYGREERIAELDERRRGPSGDEAHSRAVSNQQQERQSQQEADESRRRVATR
jgi:K+/H+ antiporter YhaU regulatory subunit KhtT